jgi:hypothetical protein
MNFNASSFPLGHFQYIRTHSHTLIHTHTHTHTHIITHITTYIIFRTIHFMSPFGQTIPGVSLRYNHTVSSNLNFTSNKTKTFFHYLWRIQVHTVSQLVTATKRSPNSSTYNEGLSESSVGLYTCLINNHLE